MLRSVNNELTAKKDQGFTLMEVLVSIVLAAMLGTMLLAMTIATQKQIRAYEARTDANRDTIAFDAAFQSAWDTAQRVRLIGSTGTATTSDRNQLLFDFTDSDDNCAAMRITTKNGKPVPSAPKVIDYTQWQIGVYEKSGEPVATCAATAVTDATIEWLPTIKWQPRPISLQFFDTLGVDITTLTATGWDAANFDQPVNASIAKLTYTRQRNTVGTANISYTYPLKRTANVSAAVACSRPNTDWMPLELSNYSQLNDYTSPNYMTATEPAGGNVEYRVFWGDLQFRGEAISTTYDINNNNWSTVFSATLPHDYWPEMALKADTGNPWSISRTRQVFTRMDYEDGDRIRFDAHINISFRDVDRRLTGLIDGICNEGMGAYSTSDRLEFC